MGESIWFFEKVNLYKLLCPHSYEQYKKLHKSIQYKKNDLIYDEEDSADKIFLVESGKVKIGKYDDDGNEYINSILIKGDLFGEKAILGEDTRQEFAKALDNNTSICVLKVEDIYGLVAENKNMSLYIHKVIRFRIRKLERRLHLMLFKDAKTRLIEFLNEMTEEYGKKNILSGEIIIPNPYSQQEMAVLIGVKRPTLSTLLSSLKEDGIIDYSKNQIILKNQFFVR